MPIQNAFTKYCRAKINAASISFRMCCPFGALWDAGPDAAANAIGYAEHFSRSHDTVIRVYDDAGNLSETHEQKGDFEEW